MSDTGTGMDAATLRRAVEPFFSTKDPDKGTGLGLSMVHGLAAQSGGALHLSSRPGAGTTASLWLPLAERRRARRARCRGRPSTRRGPRPSWSSTTTSLVRMGTACLLEELGHTVVEADDGEAALDILRERRDIDLIITDYAMPGMNGVALARAAASCGPAFRCCW